MTKHTLWITIILALVLLSGCNTENDGIFMRISKSETKTDVGTITLIASDGTDFYAQTKQHQLQVYNKTTKNWTNLAPDKQATHVATDGTNIYFAPSVVGNVNNPISKYDTLTKNITSHNDTYDVVAMSPTADLMVVKNGLDNFDILKVSTGTFGVASNFTFFETLTPQLIVQDNTNFIVSGKTAASVYTHYLYDGTFHTINGVNSPVVAFYNDGINIVLLTDSGATWHGTVGGSYADFAKIGTVPDFPPRSPSDKPYPVFFHGGKLYLQDKNKYLHSITTSGVVAKVTDIDLSAVKAWSYLVDSDIIYVGTTQNGIFKIDMGASPKTFTSL